MLIWNYGWLRMFNRFKSLFSSVSKYTVGERDCGENPRAQIQYMWFDSCYTNLEVRGHLQVFFFNPHNMATSCTFMYLFKNFTMWPQNDPTWHGHNNLSCHDVYRLFSLLLEKPVHLCGCIDRYLYLTKM